MTREILDQKIIDLLNEVLSLGKLVEDAILGSVESLKTRDFEASRKIYVGDQVINDKRFEIENNTLILIATQQPLARDLRILASVLDIASELERMGDYAKGIARINIRLGKEPLLKPLIDVPKMADLTIDMLNRALQAFINADEQEAWKIPKDDDEVDRLYNLVYHELLTFMISDPTTIDKATYLLWVAHNLERTADRVTNICERTIFVATGELIQIDISDDEMSKTDGIAHLTS